MLIVIILCVKGVNKRTDQPTNNDDDDGRKRKDHRLNEYDVSMR